MCFCCCTIMHVDALQFTHAAAKRAISDSKWQTSFKCSCCAHSTGSRAKHTFIGSAHSSSSFCANSARSSALQLLIAASLGPLFTGDSSSTNLHASQRLTALAADCSLPHGTCRFSSHRCAAALLRRSPGALFHLSVPKSSTQAPHSNSSGLL